MRRRFAEVLTLWYQPLFRQALAQLGLLLLLVYLMYSAYSNVLFNLASQGITSGFGFLNDRAGFNIIMHLIPFDESSTYFRAFWVGLCNTLFISAIGVVLATVIGFFVGVSRLSGNALLRGLAASYIELIRNIPLLLQIFFWYFAVLRALPRPRQSHSFFDFIFINNRGFYFPTLKFEVNVLWVWAALILFLAAGVLGFYIKHLLYQKNSKRYPILSALAFLGVAAIVVLTYVLPEIVHLQKPELRGFNFTQGWVMIPEFTALLLALSLYTAAFIAEIVRSGILSVSQGQWEAAQSLGLTHAQILKLIVIPQALRVIIPPLTNQYLNLTKNSSLAAAIAYPDLVSVFAGTVLNQTGQAVEVIGVTMAVYLVISLSISSIMLLYERHQNKGER